MAAKTIMVANYKGGIGKTQTALELAWWLSRKGARVLCVDLDHQASLTKILSENRPLTTRPLPEILIAGDRITYSDISSRLIDCKGNKIDFIASSLAAGRLEKKLPDDTPKEYVLKDALLEVRSRYDFIIMDAPPAAEVISICGMVASDHILLPCMPTSLSIDGIAGIMPIIRRIQSHPRMNPGLTILGIIVTMYEDTIDARTAVQQIRHTHMGLVRLPVIRKCTKVRESNRKYEAVLSYAPNSTSALDYNAVFERMFPALSYSDSNLALF